MANAATLWNSVPGPIQPGTPSGVIERTRECINTLDQRTGNLDTSGNPTIPQVPFTCTLATLPDAATYIGALIWVSDANSDAGSLCISDGTNWNVIAQGAPVSLARIS